MNRNELSAPSNVSREQQRRGNDSAISANDIDEVYRRLTRLYGHKFTSGFGERDDGTWLMALSGLTQRDLSRGLTALLHRVDEWPPTVPKFRQLCLGIDSAAIREQAERIATQRAGGSYNVRMMSSMDWNMLVRQCMSDAVESLADKRVLQHQQAIENANA